MAIAMHTYTWTLQGVPNRWQRVPLNNPLGFKHNPLEGAGIYIYFDVCCIGVDHKTSFLHSFSFSGFFWGVGRHYTTIF